MISLFHLFIDSRIRIMFEILIPHVTFLRLRAIILLGEEDCTDIQYGLSPVSFTDFLPQNDLLF